MKMLILFVLLAIAATPAFASLKVGDHAPDFTARATLGGKEFTFHLADALKMGPVVVYFYPAAFTQGCTVEAHEFAAAIPQFQALATSVIGVSHDDIATLDRFSVSECQSKFPVAADEDRHIMKSYDATLGMFTAYANRTSYVISQDGKIAFAYSDLDPEEHVSRTLKALQELRH